MVRRLLALLLALVLVPASLPSATHSAGMARRHRPVAERTPGVQVASLAEPQALHALLTRTAGRSLRGAVLDGRAQPLDRQSTASRARLQRSGVLGAGFALVPLRM